MKKSQKIFLLVIIIIAVLASSSYMLYRQNQARIAENNTVLLEKYPILADKSWTQKTIRSLAPQQWNVPVQNTVVNLVQGSENEFSCDGAKARVINYTPYTVYNSFGGWDSITIVDCGLYYFVYEHKYAGSELYGPFEPGTMAPTSSTADWKTFRNEKFGFEFKYPTGFTAVQEDGDGSSPDVVWIRIFCTDGFSMCGQQAMSIYAYDTKVRQSLIGQTGITQTLENGNYKYDIDASAMDSALAKQILSTFKFISSNANALPATTSWKTYTNSDYGYEIQYPAFFKVTPPNKYKDQTLEVVELSNDDTTMSSLGKADALGTYVTSASVSIGTDTNCSFYGHNKNATIGSKTIGGVNFQSFSYTVNTTGDVGDSILAVNSITDYLATRKSICYEITTLFSYPPNKPTTPNDQIIADLFNNITNSFKFTK